MTKRKKPRPDTELDGAEALRRTEELARKILAVPKSEIQNDNAKERLQSKE